MKLLIGAIASIFILSFAIGASAPGVYKLDIDDLVTKYNDNIASIPGPLKGIFGNERINVYVDGKILVGLVGVNGTIVEHKQDGIEKPTMKIMTDSDTIGKIISNQKTFADAIRDKSITYSGVGFGNSVKFAFIRIIQNIFIH